MLANLHATADDYATDYATAADPLATTIRPTLGRIVWYFLPGRAEPVAPAVVCFVADAGPGTVPTVDVETFGRNGRVIDGLPIYDAGQGPLGEERCEWMPFQQQQAAKLAA